MKLRNFEAKTGHSTSSQKNIERNKRSAKEPLLDDSMWDLIKGILACVTVIITFVIIFSI